jgi:hypothetical protein
MTSQSSTRDATRPPRAAAPAGAPETGELVLDDPAALAWAARMIRTALARPDARRQP